MPAINVKIHVDDLPGVLQLFDRIQVWRSTGGIAGSYADISADANEAASIIGSVAAPWALSGQTLTLTINRGDPFSYTFTGTNPLNLGDVLRQLNLTGFPIQAVQSAAGSAKVLIRTTGVGSGASIQASGAAATLLGLPTAKANGKGVRPYLTSPTTEYKFSDLDGDAGYFYKTRFCSTTTGELEAFSDPQQGAVERVLALANLSKAYLYMADAAGQPIVGRRIIFVPMGLSQVSVGSPAVNYGIFPSGDRMMATTNYLGYAEQYLVRGAAFRVMIEGTGYQRDIVVPNTTDFDLLALVSTMPDPFDIVQVPQRPIRSTT